MNSAQVADLTPSASSARQEISLPLGLLGFERYKQYELVSHPAEAPFCWLTIHDDPTLAFLLVPASEAVPNYQPDISSDDVGFLALTAPEDAVVFNIVTVRGRSATVNLKGPIIVNRHTRIGKQVVPLNASEYPTQFPLAVAE